MFIMFRGIEFHFFRKMGLQNYGSQYNYLFKSQNEHRNKSVVHVRRLSSQSSAPDHRIEIK